MTTATRGLSLPGPRRIPGLGNAGSVFRFFTDPIGYTSQLFKSYGPLVSLASGGGTRLFSPLPYCPGTVLAYGPDLVREVTSQHDVYYKYPASGTLYPLGDVAARMVPLKHYGVGLFGVNGNEHRRHRRLLMPVFHKKRVETYGDAMVAITQSVLDSWQVGERRDIAESMRLLTLRVATKTLFGKDIGEAGGNLGQLIKDSLVLLSSPLTRLLPRDLPGLPYRRFLNLAAQIDGEMRAIIAHKRAGSDDDVLSMLTRARDAESDTALSEDELIGHAGVIFAAGYETSSSALTWTLFLLSQHPPVAAALLDELEGVLHGEAPTTQQLKQLPLLERVIKESMRVLPPVPFNGRVTARPTELGGHVLPPGTEVLVSIYHTHHMPELYPQPEVFNPQRWETITPNTFEYNPFSAGPRMCIGATFAMMEIKIVLAMLLQRYRLQCIPKLEVNRQGAITMSAKQGMPMIVHRQDRRFAEGVGGVSGNIREMVQLVD